MDRLEMLCRVLGSHYESKLEDLGLVPDQAADDEATAMLEQQIGILEKTRAARFMKLQNAATKLRDLWKFLSTPATEILEFAEVLICADAGSAEELTNENSLSVSLIAKVTKEIDHLQNSKDVKLKNRYLNKRNKLLKMLQENHLIPAEFNFDPKVEVSDFTEATAKLKGIIKEVKVEALARKEIVMRTEVLMEAVKQPLCPKSTERLLQTLKNMVTDEKDFLFDGKDIKVRLQEIEAEIKPEVELPPKKRASARLRSQPKGVAAESPDLPSPPYPSGVRGGHRTSRNQKWGKNASK